MTAYHFRPFVIFVSLLLSIQHYVYPLAIDERALRNGRSKAVDFIDEKRAKSEQKLYKKASDLYADLDYEDYDLLNDKGEYIGNDIEKAIEELKKADESDN